jgi:hypothetical protein
MLFLNETYSSSVSCMALKFSSLTYTVFVFASSSLPWWLSTRWIHCSHSLNLSCPCMNVHIGGRKKKENRCQLYGFTFVHLSIYRVFFFIIFVFEEIILFFFANFREKKIENRLSDSFLFCIKTVYFWRERSSLIVWRREVRRRRA